MDPNATLADLRRELSAYFAGNDVDTGYIFDRIDALDSWLSHGGFLPDDWRGQVDAVHALQKRMIEAGELE